MSDPYRRKRIAWAIGAWVILGLAAAATALILWAMVVGFLVIFS